MDMVGKNTNVEPPKESEDAVNYQAPNISSSDWHLNGNNLTNTSMGVVTMGKPMVDSSSCSSAPMMDSFCPSIWDQPMNGQSLGYPDMNIAHDSRNALLRNGVFQPTLNPRMLPHILPPFPADSGFIERAARFSCFSGGSFSEMVNPFSIPEHLNPQSQGFGPLQEDVFLGGNGSRLSSEKHEMNEHGTENGRSPFKNERKIEGFTRSSHDEAKNGADEDTQCDDAGFSGRGVQDESDEPSGKGKKRKRIEQKTEQNKNNEAPQTSVETAKDDAEIRENQNPSSTGGKNGKQEPQGYDPPKEDYIHIRARRGQATNSHSLAERIRREKISERMKFLQDLVPGCSKVTGKAVMLDEIINYVQSLQRQVEFLSMKLATVNPRLDINMEGFLAKDILQPRGGFSSSLPFPHDMSMPYLPFQPPQTGLLHAGLPNSSDALHRQISLQSTVACGGFREAGSQGPNAWEDELHNVIHNNGFNSSSPPNSQDLSVSLPSHMKAEP